MIFASFKEARCHMHSNSVRRNIESEVLVGHRITARTEARSRDAEEMSSSATAPQQERSREAAGMQQKQAGTQNECKDVTRGRWQEEGKKNPIRNAKRTSSSAGASGQKRRKPHQERSRN